MHLSQKVREDGRATQPHPSSQRAPSFAEGRGEGQTLITSHSVSFGCETTPPSPRDVSGVEAEASRHAEYRAESNSQFCSELMARVDGG